MEPNFQKERFQFKLTINDNIICQRYFRINNFNKKSLTSWELKNALESAVDKIKEDLNSKTRVAAWYLYDKDYVDTNPQETSAWDVLNREFRTKTTDQNTLTFSFIADDELVSSISWDANVYPSFVRNSIDLSNKKFKYENTSERNLDYTTSILKKMCMDKTDLIPAIIKPICEACSRNTKSYYDLPQTLKDSQKEIYDKYEKAVSAKTKAYFSKV